MLASIIDYRVRTATSGVAGQDKRKRGDIGLAVILFRTEGSLFFHQEKLQELAGKILVRVIPVAIDQVQIAGHRVLRRHRLDHIAIIPERIRIEIIMHRHHILIADIWRRARLAIDREGIFPQELELALGPLGITHQLVGIELLDIGRVTKVFAIARGIGYQIALVALDRGSRRCREYGIEGRLP